MLELGNAAEWDLVPIGRGSQLQATRTGVSLLRSVEVKVQVSTLKKYVLVIKRRTKLVYKHCEEEERRLTRSISVSGLKRGILILLNVCSLLVL